MAQRAIKNVKEDVLKCPICLDPYTNPRMLPCEHTLCLECLTEYITVARSSLGTFNSFMCPTCKDNNQIDPKMDSDKVAKTFPVSTFLEAINQAINQHELPELSCDIHGKRPMEFYCFTDHLPLCSHCLFKNHRNQKCEVVAVNECFERKKYQLEEMKQKLVNQIKEMDEVVLCSYKRKTHKESIKQAKLVLNKMQSDLAVFYLNAGNEIDNVKRALDNVPYIEDNTEDEEIRTLKIEVEETKNRLEKIDNGLNFCVHFDNIKSRCDDLISKYKPLKEKSETNSKVVFVPKYYISSIVRKPKPLLGTIKSQGHEIPLSDYTV
ncbi:tripartite motif-containing protein 12A-like [Mytilus trossulus]|uniref:tripartite motif-containing protein 12A-like n=1 Tax=Mytilus trossulus TaxID=6551 RepID=UPI003004F497